MHACTRFSIILLLAVCGSIVVRTTLAEDWPQWRGPQANGISRETGLPTKFSKNENVLWRLELPGPAGSTPVVSGDRIFLTSAEAEDLVLMAITTSGKPLWRQVVCGGNRRVQGDEGNMASPSPSTDGKHVWAMMATGHLACYSVDGEEVWKFNLQDRYGKFGIMFGMATTPLLDGDRIYLQLLHANASLVLAFDKLTGAEVWKQERKTDVRPKTECEQSYASVVIYRDQELELLLSHGADYVIAHQLSDGAEVWRCGGMNNKGRYNPSLRFVASPTVAPGLVVVPSAKKGPVLGLDPKAKGDVTDTAEGHVWTRARNTPDVPSPLIVDGLVYLCTEDGALICMDAKTGEEHYMQRAHADRHRASPVYADGKIFLTARDGTVTVVKPGKEFEILASNNMEESISASPVIANGRIYLRSFEALYAIGQVAEH